MGVFRLYNGADGKSRIEDQSLASHPLSLHHRPLPILCLTRCQSARLSTGIRLPVTSM
jgi:hypothetical protein